MPPRKSLPNRRACHTFELEYGCVRFAVHVGAFDSGLAAEVFVTGAKAGSDVQGMARDGAILLSLALQFGVPLETIRHAVTRGADGSPASLIGALADSVTEEGGHLAAMVAAQRARTEPWT